jgi:murein DD-endopeptidase MepM/ murein hydrolase activator NlpD
MSIDPDLLVAQPGDSDQTKEARAKLAELAAHLEEAVGRYDAAASKARDAERHAHDVHADLVEARRVAAVAAERFREDRDNLVTMVNGAYVTGSIGTVGLVLSSDDGTDLAASMTIAEQVNVDQSAVVEAAQASAQRLAKAEEKAEALDVAAKAAVATTSEALGKADAARQDVVDDVAEARRLLEESVLADQVEAAARAAALAGMRLAKGSVVFPLAPGAAFVDQGNFGHSGGRWASYHTGNDFSTSCGTPVLAATAGTVVIRTDQSWSGRWLVMVSTGPGRLATWYAHMQGLSVHAGERVKAGQVIGQVGTEGNSSGCHLHFELHPAGGSIYQDATDPVPWLVAVGAYPGR